MARRPRGAFIVVLGFLVVLAAVESGSWRVVVTRSVARGLYRESEPRLERGRLVEFCLCSGVANLARRRGYVPKGECPGGVMPVVKYIAAIAGDEVEVGASSVRVNGRPLRFSDRPRRDAKGRRVPRVGEGRLVVGKGELWLHSGYHPRGLDSRLCGPVALWQVVTGLEPIWTE